MSELDQKLAELFPKNKNKTKNNSPVTVDKAFELNLSDQGWILVFFVGKNYLSGSLLQHSGNLRLCCSNYDFLNKFYILMTCPFSSSVWIIFHCLKALWQISILSILSILAINLEKGAVCFLTKLSVNKEGVSLH